jgi:hypothetical protein
MKLLTGCEIVILEALFPVECVVHYAELRNMT